MVTTKQINQDIDKIIKFNNKDIYKTLFVGKLPNNFNKDK